MNEVCLHDAPIVHNPVLINKLNLASSSFVHLFTFLIEPLN